MRRPRPPLEEVKKVLEEKRTAVSYTLITICDYALELEEALQHVQDCGHNDDCLFCARKDTIAKKAKGEEAQHDPTS